MYIIERNIYDLFIFRQKVYEIIMTFNYFINFITIAGLRARYFDLRARYFDDLFYFIFCQFSYII